MGPRRGSQSSTAATTLSQVKATSYLCDVASTGRRATRTSRLDQPVRHVAQPLLHQLPATRDPSSDVPPAHTVQALEEIDHPDAVGIHAPVPARAHEANEAWRDHGPDLSNLANVDGS